MSLINKIIFKIYDNQLKDVDKKQENMTWDEDVIIEENIPYKEGNDPLLMYDYIYKKDNPKKESLPLIINIHGGAFSGGDKQVNKYYGAFLAKHNYQVATINYHYLPEANLKRQVQDSLEAISYITKKYKKDEFFLTGDSSGSDLVLLISLLWNNKAMQNAYEVKVPNAKIKALGLTGTQASINMFPPFMKPFNKENRRILLDGCSEIDEYVEIEKLWNKDVPPIYIMSAEEDVNYSNCRKFEDWLTTIKHPHKSYYCKKNEEGKLYHCFNVIRPDLNCSKKMNEAMIEFFKEQQKEE